MSVLQKTNYATTNIITSNVGVGVTDLYCTVGTGALFPQTGTFKAAIWVSTAASPGLDATREIVEATFISTDRFSITRAQEGTGEGSWVIGDYFALVNTAGTMQELETFIQNSLLSFAGTTGSSNVYTAVMDPDITAYTTGLAMNIRFTNSNTAAATLGLNTLTPKYIYRVEDGAITRIASGDIIAGMYSMLYYDDTLDGGAGGWMMTNPASSVFKPGDIFPAATSMIFNQASAPTGWTKQTGWSTSSSILVGDTYSSGGGSDNPISWTTALSVNTHTAHQHKVGIMLAANLFLYDINGSTKNVINGSVNIDTGLNDACYKRGTDYSGESYYTLDNSGDATSMAHTINNDTYTPRYVQTIICNKN